MKIIRRTILSLLLLSSMGAAAQTTIYTNDMDYVIGDVKQAFIQDKISSVDQIVNLLAGFKTMQVNGIRVPIFPAGLAPNEPALAYFIEEAKKEGFLIFANPAQGTGGKHVATGEWFSDKSVKDDDAMTQNLINRILEFDKTYPCKWINPFNEDGRTNTVWSIDQINTIYSSVKAGLVNAELIGSCAWGLPASIDIFKKTNIKDYITVSTSHNLGFHHSQWTEFINLSHAAGLPVWDSEVNNDDKNKDGYTRIVAAIEYKVDGMVLYNSWNFINLNTGAVNATGNKFMNMYLKPAAIEETHKQELFADLYQENEGFRVEFLTPSQSHKVSVRDITGKQVRLYNSVSNSELQVNNLKQGMYVVIMSANEQVQVEKIMVQ